MPQLSRRQGVVLGGVGIAAITTGVAGLVGQQRAGTGASRTKWKEPPRMASVDGRLDVELTAGQHQAQLAGRDVSVLAYNGLLPGPTLVLQPGDHVRLRLDNQLPEPTNLHVHGLHVSPQDNSDNVLISIEPTEAFDYEYQLPPDHPPGVYWYHPHHHGTVADQLFGGLYGAIIVEDPQPIPVTRERIVVISDITMTGEDDIARVTPMEQMRGREGNIVLVNGQVHPTLHAQPQDRERWRIINACTSRYVKLALDEHTWELLGKDSGRYPKPRVMADVLLPPGQRADVLVTAQAGTAILRAVTVDRGRLSPTMGGPNASSPGLPPRDVPLATFAVSGTAAHPMPPVPRQTPLRDLRAEPITAKRELVFGMQMGGMRRSAPSEHPQPQNRHPMMAFTINGQVFDPQRIDTTVSVGSIEEWVLTNITPMDHPVHVHVWPMQLIHTPDRSIQEPEWQDVVNIPPQSSITVRVAFDTFVGQTVYHCHILDHEDLGMMGLLEVR